MRKLTDRELKAQQNAEIKAGNAMFNANNARARGNFKLAAKYDDRAQHWYDVMRKYDDIEGRHPSGKMWM
jgi:hypothetical protein